MSNNPLVGTWKLVHSGMSSSEDSTELEMYGTGAVGYIPYNHDRYVYGHVGNINLPTSGLVAEVAKAVGISGATYLSYFGTYKVEGNIVINSIKISSHPNFLQGDRQIEFEIQGDRLNTIQHIQVSERIQLTVRREWEKA